MFPLSTGPPGEVLVEGITVSNSPKAVRRELGSVSQNTTADLLCTGRENLRLQGQLYGHSGSELEGRVTELLDMFMLSDAANRKTMGYSGGMKRRLDVAIGLVHRPKTLVLDEPTTGLDPESRAVMWRE